LFPQVGAKLVERRGQKAQMRDGVARRA
jgi:hypothetical protein